MVGEPGSEVIAAETALRDELDEIERRRGHPAAAQPAPGGEPLASRASRLELTALCLSGGGVRSAAFSLGVLQSLAGKRLLNEFDYLSTVSGGGFIGGWLQMAIRECGDIASAQAVLAQDSAPPLRRLRAFSDYLTPRTGLLSFDTWAAVVLYLRNMILNWTVFTPLFLLLALVAIFYRTAIASTRDAPAAILVATAVATAALAWSSWQACSLVPSHRAESPGFAGTRDILYRVALPAVVWALLAPLVINHQIFRGLGAVWTIPLCYAVAMLGGYALAWVFSSDRHSAQRRLFRDNAVRWFLAIACGTGLTVLAIQLIQPGGAVYRVAAFRPVTGAPPLLVDRETALGAFGPIWLLGTHMLHTSFYVAFRREALYFDLDREWLGRLNGSLLLMGTGWTGFAAICLVLPVMLGFLPFAPLVDWQPAYIAMTGGATTLAGAVGAWLGKKLVSAVGRFADDRRRLSDWVPNVFSAVFGLGIFVCGSSVVQHGLGVMTEAARPGPGGLVTVGAARPHWIGVLATQVGLALVLALLAFLASRVNVNRFSLHAIYRNRLTRAFLGSARERRRPDPFTDFDPDDNPRFKTFAEAVAGQRLFPVINMTLNVTSGMTTAWSERKAESFTATPLACGSATLRHPAQRCDQGPAKGAFVPTSRFGGMESLGDKAGRDQGPHLGSLLTISGAAVSPFWGYHSARLTAFVMTLFNVRLGAWLPNPATATAGELQLARPRNPELSLIRELVGDATDTSQALYLSDGGHFENLGLYEMLRRRCRRIVVVDAGQDGTDGFFDLGNAIRRGRIDFGIEINLQPRRILSRRKIETDSLAAHRALGFTVGTITYPDAAAGTLLYLKPSFLDGIPTDVRAYGNTDDAFPQDSTLQQWFTESQFESYRALGRWQVDQLQGGSLAAVFTAAEVDSHDAEANPS